MKKQITPDLTSDLCRHHFFLGDLRLLFRQQASAADGAAVTTCATQATTQAAAPETTNRTSSFAPSEAQLSEGEALLLKIRRSTTTRTDADGCAAPRKLKDGLGPGARHRVEVGGQNVTQWSSREPPATHAYY